MCYADGLQMHVGIEPGRMRAFELVEERVLVAAVPDVIANVIGVFERQNDDIMSASITKRARAGCLGFFVFGFAVNDGSGRLARVFTHPFPNAHYVSARGIDNLAAAILDLLLVDNFGSEGGAE